MESGDYFQYPNYYPFKVPESYNDVDENTRKELFWVKMMQPDQPFKFADDKMLHSKPICWTNKPKQLSNSLDMPVKTIEETQKTLLYQALLNSVPVRPQFLQEYELELNKTVAYLMQKSIKGVFQDRQSLFQCIKDLRELIAYKIKNDHAGTFDVIMFLKDMRSL